MRRAVLAVALMLTAPPGRAADPSCEAVEEATRRACAASAPREKRGSERFQFDQDLCSTAARVARRACDRGVHAERYQGGCARQAEYVSDVMAEACRLVLYRNPRPFVKVGFKAYDERCQRHARAAEERALEDACPAHPHAGEPAAPSRGSFGLRLEASAPPHATP